MKKVYSAFESSIKELKGSVALHSKKRTNSGIFGIPIEELMNREENKGSDFPNVFLDTIRYIEDRGTSYTWFIFFQIVSTL